MATATKTNETKQITLTEALVKKKILQHRIQKLVGEFVPCATTTEGTAPAGYESVATFESKIKADYESISTLISNYYDLQDAIVKANAITEVKVTRESGETRTMTIAQALIRKNQASELEGALRHRMAAYFNSNQRDILKRQNEIPALVNAQINTLTGKAGQKVDQDQLDKIKKSVTELHSLVLRDPIGLQNKIKDLDNDKEFYGTALDVALSLANATTHIEVPVSI